MAEIADTQKYEILHRWSTRRGVDRSVDHNPGDVVTADEIQIDAGKDKGRFIAELLSLNLIRPIEVAPLPQVDPAVTELPRPSKRVERAGALAELVGTAPETEA